MNDLEPEDAETYLTLANDKNPISQARNDEWMASLREKAGVKTHEEMLSVIAQMQHPVS